MGKRLNLNLHLESNQGFLEAAVMAFYQQLQENENKGKNKDYLTAALLGYWEAMAYQDLGLVGDERERQSQLSHNLHCLRQQINYLQDRFDLDYDPSAVRKLLKLGRTCSDRSRESVTFAYRYQVAEDSPEGRIAQWLSQSKSGNSVAQKVMWASVGYWGAVACSQLQWLEPEQLPNCALNCIYRLEEQIDYLTEVLCPERLVVSPSSASAPETAATPSPEPSLPEAEATEGSKSQDKSKKDDPDYNYLLDPEIWAKNDEVLANMFPN